MLKVISSKKNKRTLLLAMLLSLTLVGCKNNDKQATMEDYQKVVDEYKGVEEHEDTPENVSYDWSYYDEELDVATDEFGYEIYKAHNYYDNETGKETNTCIDCGNKKLVK